MEPLWHRGGWRLHHSFAKHPTNVWVEENHSLTSARAAGLLGKDPGHERPNAASLQMWLEREAPEIRQELNLGYGGLRAPSAPDPQSAPGESSPPPAQFVRGKMREWMAPITAIQSPQPKELTFMNRASSLVAESPDGSTLITELLWGVQSTMNVALFVDLFGKDEDPQAHEYSKNRARMIQSGLASYLALKQIEAKHVIPTWLRDLVKQVGRDPYTSLTPPDLGLTPSQTPERATHVVNLLTELLWVLRRVNALVKHGVENRISPWVARAVQLRAALVHLGARGLISDWQDRYLDRALQHLRPDETVYSQWSPFLVRD